MKNNLEWERSDLVVDPDMEVECDEGTQIVAYLETWFDVDKKFRTNTANDSNSWVNLYAKFDPFADALQMEYCISTDKGSTAHKYYPTPAEEQLVKDLITEKIQQLTQQTPQEYCMEVTNDYDLGGII